MKTSKYFKIVKIIGICSMSLLACIQLNAQTPVKKTTYSFGNIRTKPVVSYEELNGFFTDSVLQETINDTSLEKKINSTNHQTPIIRKEDVQFFETIWEDIDGREKKNRLLLYEQNAAATNDRFIAILINALVNDSANIKAYSDDLFTTKKSLSDIETLFNGPMRPVTVTRLDGTTYDTLQPDGSKALATDSIYAFRIKSQYIYDSRNSRMYYRIIGIAPLARIPGDSTVNSDGSKSAKESSPLFWVSYPKLRIDLKNIPIYNPKNSTDIVDWAKILEHKYFDGHIVKTSYENFKDQSMSDIYKDPKKRLQLADKIIERIDNFEQDRWVY
jgi:gliding motility associated protien GldN